MWFAYSFSHSEGCLFIWLMISFAVLKCFKLMKSHVSFLLLPPVFLVSRPKNFCEDQCQGALSLCFLLRAHTWRIWCLAQPLCFMSANKVILEGMLKPLYAHKNSLWKKICVLWRRGEKFPQKDQFVFLLITLA